MFTLTDTVKRFFTRKRPATQPEYQQQTSQNEPYNEQQETGIDEILSTHYRYNHYKHRQIIQAAIDSIETGFKPLDNGTGTDDIGNSPVKSNAMTGRQAIPDRLMSWYVSQGFIGYQACSFISQHWLIDKACSIKGRDAIRKGFEILIDEGINVDPEVIERIEQLNKKFHLKNTLEQAEKFKNVYGLYHILYKVESTDPDYYEKPYNPDGITPGAYKGMVRIDPYWISPVLSEVGTINPDSHSFYEPEYWIISGRKYHKSHFVIVRGPEVCDVLKPSYHYGGIPLTQRIMERVYASERTANEAPQLAMTKRLIVRYIDKLEKAMANPEAFEQGILALSEFRDNFGIFVDSKDNTIQQNDTSLTDLDSVIMTQYQLVASIAGIPATKLLGTSPKGFQATGEHEINSYHEELESIQENDLTPIIDRHHECLIRSHLAHKLTTDEILNISICWNPLAVMSEREQAEVAELRARTDQIELGVGSIDQYDIRDRLIADEISGYSAIERVDRPEYINELPDTMEEIPQEPVPQVL